MRLVWQLLAVAAVAFIGGQGVAAMRGNPWLTLALGVLTAVLAVLVHGWVVRRTEHRPVTEVARKGAGTAITRGVLIGVALFGAVTVNIYFLGYDKVHGPGSRLFGCMLAAAYVATRNLWVRIGVHVGRRGNVVPRCRHAATTLSR
ncbi:hypothetical protein [Nonomuraea sp. NPDC049141]|uniref:hypothetical protein n=1 Tax=unclassified Nonomuraea TaxID=2593643 RepID=UPI003401848C